MKEGLLLLPQDEGRARRLAALAAELGLIPVLRAPLPGLEGALLLARQGEGHEGALRLARVSGPEDLEQVIGLAARHARVLVEAQDWKIIPIENLLARLPAEARLYATARSASEARQLLHVLERGVTGALLESEDPAEIRRFAEVLREHRWLELRPAEVKEVLELGPGDRACIDTVGLLRQGSGLLVGSRASFLFLVHAETQGSAFVPPRPFRVNAGAVHSYVLMPDMSTRYLCELRAGDRVLVVDSEGVGGPIAVGRSKIERRPLKLVRASLEGEEGSITLQDAETICLVREGGSPQPITALGPGERVLVHASRLRARHLGMSVDEFIIEK
ncbi:MAG: 3-dehydroquinate synthase [Nitrososphaerota archaeon]